MPRFHRDVASKILNSPTLLSPSERQEYANLEDQALVLQERIDEIRRQLALLRLGQNALIPINRHPNEILLAIFAHLAPISIHSEPASPSLCRDIITVTHVCARWRAVALAKPTLWTSVPIYAIEQAATFFQRSGHRPLYVSVGPRFPDPVSAESLRPGDLDSDPSVVLPHTSRLRSLSLTSMEECPSSLEDMLRWMVALLEAAQTLEELSVRIDFWFRWDAFDLNGPCPAIRSLTLDGLEVPPDFPAFGPALLHLTLAPRPTFAGFSDRELFEILCRCPNLETLTLCHYLDRDIDEETNEIYPALSGPVALPFLTTLTLRRVHPGFPNLILRALSLPATVKIDIEISHTPRTSETDTLVLPQSSSTLPSLSGIRHLGISVKVRRPGGAADGPFMALSSPPRDTPFVLRASHDRDHDPTPALTLRLNYDDTTTWTWLSRLSSLIDVRSVETCELHFDTDSAAYDRPTEQTWAAALKDLTGLRILRSRSRELVASAVLYAPLLSALSPTAHGDAAWLVCPRLKTLALEGVDCDDEFWRVLERTIIARRAAGASPLTEVVLKDLIGIVDVNHAEVRKVCELLGESLTLEHGPYHAADSTRFA